MPSKKLSPSKLKAISYPRQGRYAVIRMDPVASVFGLKDPEAVAAAQAIRPQTYLAYIHTDVTLPIPGRPWYIYSISLVGTSLRASDPVHGIDSSMCVPIYPNTSHPEEREPVYPEPFFPFDNCYHWHRTRLTVRVRARPEGWTASEDHATELSSDEMSELIVYLQMDALRAQEVVRERESGGVIVPIVYPPLDAPESVEEYKPLPLTSVADFSRENGSAAPPSSSSVPRTSSDNQNPSTTDSTAPTETISRSCSNSSPPPPQRERERDAESIVSVDTIGSAVNITTIRLRAKDAALLPVVDLWYELTDHLTQEVIPSPVAFIEERDAFVR
ncbi:hypothetical protein C8Q74DRAFT_1192663 [Fomes fomentarius]|nr:hypothetical protein C8Q74DRAFT_1192663 [Fomes fomentarius]